MEIINKLESGIPVKKLVVMFGITASVIYNFSNEKTLIKARNESAFFSGKKTLHKLKEKDLDKYLYAWFLKNIQRTCQFKDQFLLQRRKS